MLDGQALREIVESGALDEAGDIVHGLLSLRQLSDPTVRSYLQPPPWEDGWKDGLGTVSARLLTDLLPAMLLVGAVGSGKSTLLRLRALAAANSFLAGDLAVPPVYVELRHVASGLLEATSDGVLSASDLAHAACVSLQRSPHADLPAVEEWTSQGCELIVDGLDELAVVLKRRPAAALESAVLQTLDRCAGRGHKIVASTRPGVASTSEATKLVPIELAPLLPEESSQLVLLCVSDARGLSDDIHQALGKVPPDLRSRPLFVALIGALLRDDALPDPVTRLGLLQAGLRELLEVRVLRKQDRTSLSEIIGCDLEDLVAVLSGCSLESMLSEAIDSEAFALGVGDLMGALHAHDDEIDVSASVELLFNESGILNSDGQRARFTHRIYQEALAAFELHRRYSEGRSHESAVQLAESSPQRSGETLSLYIDAIFTTADFGALMDLADECLEGASASASGVAAARLIWTAGEALGRCLEGKVEWGRRNLPVRDAFCEDAPYYIGRTSLLSDFERAVIADIVGRLGDRRAGVGTSSSGLPEVEWVHVPEGSFRIGLLDEEVARLEDLGHVRLSRETPAATVDCPDFAIAKYPVTCAQFRAFIESPNGYADANWWPSRLEKSEHMSRLRTLVASIPVSSAPIVAVDWFEASAFARWVAAETSALIDLPTEEEWEVAARGDATTLYPWGDNFEDGRCNWTGSGFGEPVAVGLFDESDNPWPGGPADMLGNIWEWTSSVAGAASDTDFAVIGQARKWTQDVGEAVRFVVRGCSYLNDRSMLRATYRGNDVGSARFDRQGFRLVLRKST